MLSNNSNEDAKSKFMNDLRIIADARQQGVDMLKQSNEDIKKNLVKYEKLKFNTQGVTPVSVSYPIGVNKSSMDVFKDVLNVAIEHITTLYLNAGIVRKRGGESTLCGLTPKAIYVNNLFTLECLVEFQPDDVTLVVFNIFYHIKDKKGVKKAILIKAITTSMQTHHKIKYLESLAEDLKGIKVTNLTLAQLKDLKYGEHINNIFISILKAIHYLTTSQIFFYGSNSREHFNMSILKYISIFAKEVQKIEVQK